MVHVESHQRRIAQIREELRRLDAGSDVAYDMAIYDRGASVERLERNKRQLLDELEALQTGRHPKQTMLRRPDRLREDQYAGTLEELLNDEIAMDAITMWDDEDEIEARDGKFTIRYITAVKAGLLADPKGRYH